MVSVYVHTDGIVFTLWPSGLCLCCSYGMILRRVSRLTDSTHSKMGCHFAISEGVAKVWLCSLFIMLHQVQLMYGISFSHSRWNCTIQGRISYPSTMWLHQGEVKTFLISLLLDVRLFIKICECIRKCVLADITN